MSEASVGALQARVRCLSAGPLGLWFLRETLGLEGAPARALLNEGAVVDIVVDRYRLARFEVALHFWGLDFELEPPLAQLRAAIGHERAASARVGLRVNGAVRERFATIGLVRELSKLSLREARHAVQTGLPFISGLRPAQAVEIVARFAALGTQLEQVWSSPRRSRTRAHRSISCSARPGRPPCARSRCTGSALLRPTQG